ncbi:hypothetical protein GCM10009844_19360 [Nocardioides koreensis]|uniref:Lipoprotein n=1 Tax=Nocardioides koreensis TaxID=433651 RepID=A0ABP5LEE0_9ACTN
MRTSTFRHLLGAPACLLLAAASAVACQSSAPHHAHVTDRPTNQTTYFAQYGVSTRAYKPGRLNPSVDGSLYVRGMQWTVWDDRRAAGDGIAHVNDCIPDCADGHYTTYRVTVRLAQPRELCGSQFFTAIRVRGPGYHMSARRSGVACR